MCCPVVEYNNSKESLIYTCWETFLSRFRNRDRQSKTKTPPNPNSQSGTRSLVPGQAIGIKIIFFPVGNTNGTNGPRDFLFRLESPTRTNKKFFYLGWWVQPELMVTAPPAARLAVEPRIKDFISSRPNNSRDKYAKPNTSSVQVQAAGFKLFLEKNPYLAPKKVALSYLAPKL